MSKTKNTEAQVLSDSDVNVKNNTTSSASSLLLLQKKLSLLSEKDDNEGNHSFSKKPQGPTSGKYLHRIFQDTLQGGKGKPNR